MKYQLGQIGSHELADALQYVLSHAGHLTGLYRYKYKLMHQIRQCKDLKPRIYGRFNTGHIGSGPMWRVLVFFLIGIVPLLERWIGSSVAREYEGRVGKPVLLGKSLECRLYLNP